MDAKTVTEIPEENEMAQRSPMPFRIAKCSAHRCTVMLLVLMSSLVATAAERASFNDDWRFHKGNVAGAEKSSFDDSGWREIRLPHDWAIEGPFSTDYDARTGGLPVHGIGWYRKHFSIPESVRGKNIAIEFDGAMANATVWLNGTEIGERPYGYIGFSVDLSAGLNYGEQNNVLAVRLAPEDFSSRWYPGAGIYRNTWLEIRPSVHVARWGTYITTPEVSEEEATIRVRTQIGNSGDENQNIVLETIIKDPDGRQIEISATPMVIASGERQWAEQTLTIENPARWDIDNPDLYTAVSRVRQGSRRLDSCETPFGIRTIEFDAQRGFLLNGRYRKLKGVCLHHDLGPLGAAVNRRATERQLEIMKAMGCNAIRTSHNPPSPEQLEFCDKLGLVVLDEAFDCWRIPKVANGYNKYFEEWHERDLRDMIRRDRNHPSVIMWSIGNEILEQGAEDGWKLAERLTAICHEEDPTRPVTAGFNNPAGAIDNGLADQIDILGYNYQPSRYEQDLREHPDWIIVGAETSSDVSSRGIYHLPIEKYEKHPSLQITSYDIVGPSWSYPPDVEFDVQDKLPQVLGEFVWTGFDYLGEPTPFGRGPKDAKGYRNGDWPSRSSYFGIVDLCGFPKDRYYLYQSAWSDEPMVHLLPHWNWTGKEGQEIPVFCYTNCDEAELFLNGESLGRKERGTERVPLPTGKGRYFQSKYRLMWEVPYQAGTLKAVGYSNGQRLCEKVRATAGAPARITLAPDRDRISADGEDLSFVAVRIEDKDGNLCPGADNLVRFTLTGHGEIAAVGNGNAATTEPFQADYRKAFNGLCMLVVRSKDGQSGTIHIRAESEGLRVGEAEVITR